MTRIYKMKSSHFLTETLRDKVNCNSTIGLRQTSMDQWKVQWICNHKEKNVTITKLIELN